MTQIFLTISWHAFVLIGMESYLLKHASGVFPHSVAMSVHVTIRRPERQRI